MIKKILCLLFALSLCAVFPAAAEESAPLPGEPAADWLADIDEETLNP